jgi:hypothetical protein
MVDCHERTSLRLTARCWLFSSVDAVVVFGDTRHTANQPYNVGGGSGIDGIFPRPESQLEALKDWTDILWSYCGANDPICAADQNKNNYNVTQHLSYYDTHAEEAAAWIKKVAKIENNDPSFVTEVPTSLSGTAQDYSTIASDYVPSGTVASVPISTATCSTTSKSSSTHAPSTRTTESVAESTSADTESDSASATTTSSTAEESATEESTTEKSTTEDSTTVAPTTSETETSAAAAETTASDDGAASVGSVGLLGSFFLAAAAVL